MLAGDEQIGLQLRGRPTLLSLVWLDQIGLLSLITVTYLMSESSVHKTRSEFSQFWQQIAG